MSLDDEVGPELQFDQHDETRLNRTERATHGPTEVERKISDRVLRILGPGHVVAGVGRRRDEQLGIGKPCGGLIEHLLQLKNLTHADGMKPEAPSLGMHPHQTTGQFLAPAASVLSVCDAAIDEQRGHREQQQRVSGVQQPSDDEGHPFPHETSSSCVRRVMW